MDQWEFKDLGSNSLTTKEKQLVLAKVLKTAVLAIFKTHTYSFNQKYYLQKKGGPIGLRSTCCVARMVMVWWDSMLVEALEALNIKKVAGARYMDDIRIWLHAIRLGWRWVDGELLFRKEWRLEERAAGVTPLQKTAEVLRMVMNGICGWLSLTMETEEMFGGWLPTLDLEIRIDDQNRVIYRYYEKPMIPNMVLHKRSAMPESTRRSTLNQELIRRMVNTSEMVSIEERVEIIDKYATKLMHSEYPLEEARNIIIGGLKGYERLLSLSKDTTNPKWKPLHMAAGWNARNRRRAKEMSKTDWYKGKTEVEPPPRSTSLQEDPTCMKDAVPEVEEPGRKTTPSLKAGKKKRGPGRVILTLGGKKKVEKALKRKMKSKMRKKISELNIPDGRIGKKGAGPQAPVKSVLFVDNTAGGELAKRLQEAERDMGIATGYRVRVTESAGTPLGMLLPCTNPWGNADCGRGDCVPCAQPDERRMNCKKRNILYENRCTVCNKADQKDGIFLKDGKGIYVGESSRSMYERAKEHEADRQALSEDSHQVKHWLTEHQELLAPPKFHFKIIQTFQDPLSRQLAEAVRIDLRGEGVLNSKSEYNRCKVPRLRINMEEWHGKAKIDVSQEGLNKEMEDSLMEKDLKRKDIEPAKGRKSKRRKLAKLEGWGEQKSEGDENLPEGWKLTGEDLPEGGQHEHDGLGRMETMKVDNKPGSVEGVILQMGSRQDTTSAVPDNTLEVDDCVPMGWKQTSEILPEGWKTNLPEEGKPSPPASMESTSQPSTHLQPHLVSEGFVRIGLVPSRESQPPVTPVDIMAVRGEGGRGRGGNTHFELVTGGRGGVHALTSSSSKSRLSEQALGQDDMRNVVEDKVVFKKRGKLNEIEIVELKKTHKSLKTWFSKREVFRSGGGSVMGMVSHFDEPDHHGGAHTPLLGPATITEKGVGLGQVVGLQTTGDQTVHAPVLGAQAEPQSVGINCVQCTHTVQCPEVDTDLRKAEIIPASTATGVTLTLTDAEQEDFSTDMEKLKHTWDLLEKDENEWKVEDGLRRNGRKLSRRISDLVRQFEGEETGEYSNPLEGGTQEKCQNVKLISHTMGRGAIMNQNMQKNNVIQSEDLRDTSTTSERCDWLTVKNIQLSPTNGSSAWSQVADRRGNKGSAVQMN